MFKLRSLKKNEKYRATETRYRVTFRNDANYGDFDKLMGNIIKSKNIMRLKIYIKAIV